MGKDTGSNRKSGRAGGGGVGASGAGQTAPQVSAQTAAEVHKVSLSDVGANLTVGNQTPMRVAKSNFDTTYPFRLVNAYAPTEIFAVAKTSDRLMGFAADMLLTVTQG